MSYVLLCGAAVIVLCGVYILSQLKIHMGEISSFACQEKANRIISQAAQDILEKSGENDFLDISYGNDGRIISAEINSAKVNSLQNDIITAVNESFSEGGNVKTEIPVGTLTGIAYLSGRGPEIDVRIDLLGSVKSKMRSSFESAGVNQTKFSLYLDITADMKAVLPVRTKAVSAERSILISESIIVGEIPQTYLSGLCDSKMK